jgi:hypothetical protein
MDLIDLNPELHFQPGKDIVLQESIRTVLKARALPDPRFLCSVQTPCICDDFLDPIENKAAVYSL